jgi:hypothetical protein
VRHGTLQFIGVGTPPDEDGSADLQYVLAAARSIGQHVTDYKVIVDRSTMSVGQRRPGARSSAGGAGRARRVFGDLPGLSFASRQPDALRDADALLIVTEWREFRSPDFEQMRALLKQPLIFDGRNLFDPPLVRGLGLAYYAIGRGEAPRGVGLEGRGRRQGLRLTHPSLPLKYAVTEFQGEKVQDATELHVQ